MSKTILLYNDTDCNSLQENGDFQIINPVNGPADATNIIISVTAPGVGIRPDNVKQLATVLPAGVVYTRRFVPGTGWDDWEEAASGGGGSTTAESMTISNGFKSVWSIAFSTLENAIALVSDYDTLQTALVPSVVVGPANTLNAQLGVFLYAMTNLVSACGQSQAAGSAPTADHDGAGTAPGGIKFKLGTVWTDVSTKKVYILVDAATGAAVWKEVQFVG